MYVIILYLLNVAILKIFIFLLLFFKYSIILSNPYVFVENKYDFYNYFGLKLFYYKDY